MSSRKYAALILNDYELCRYAQWVKQGKKTIETRMNKLFQHRGDVVICCGTKNSTPNSPNRGKALCIVEIYDGRPMKNNEHEIDAACIGWDPNRKSLLLRNWRHFSEDFMFGPAATKHNFQGMFEVQIPDGIEIISMPKIKGFVELEENKDVKPVQMELL